MQPIKQVEIAVRVNVDESALTDPRFRRLARYLAITFFEVIGRVVPVWMTAYNRRSATLTTEDVDIAADRDGFAAAMVRADLAEQVDELRVRVRGVTERIQFLMSQVSKAKRRWDSRSNANRDADVHAEAHADADAPALPGDSRSNAVGDAYSLALATGSGSKDPARELAAVAIAEINKIAGSRYQADSAETVKNATTLARRGVATDDVRRVIAAKWAEWSKSDQMRAQFKPSVLLRPNNFIRYREDLAARAMPARLVAPTADGFAFDSDSIAERQAS